MKKIPPSWKTTAAGLLTATFGFILFSPEHFPSWLIDVAKYAMVGGLAGLGLTAKDYDVSGKHDNVISITSVKEIVVPTDPPPTATEDVPRPPVE